ncbi:hypothetical protein L798_02142 [Zootermopsis nevadensis]|uniref:Secreted protein n=1 Tax=Zootermopsis nevadensis TaxID=136037 RepID=A0A067RGT5_ZOONE|nr:hypothetical protein L798_02142 [Zootermopsis nevadensis]
MDALPNTIYLLVHLCSVVVTLLTSSGNSERHSAWMPSSNTGNFSQTFVSLPRQFLGMPTRPHTFVTFSFCDPNNINHLIRTKYLGYRYWLL